LLNRVQEVIPMRRKAYRAVRVNEVDGFALAKQWPGVEVVVGVDIGKLDLLVVLRWANGQYERPWRVANPGGIGILVVLLKLLSAGRTLRVALEPSGTYGDALRQALHDAGLPVQRVSPKAAHDYAEVFDGVPSQHDGKDAAVIAELAATGKSREWMYHERDAWTQELVCWVSALESQRRIWMLWMGQIEGLLGRHWPEATRVLKLSSGTLLRVLACYGGPAGLAADAAAAERLRRWGGPLLRQEKLEALLQGARSSAGVRQGEWECRQLREIAEKALEARRSYRHSQRQLRRLAADHPVLEAQGKVVGVPTACVLWVSTGDPRNFDSGPAYRKAMGLNLTERSSGKYQGKLRISKRGSARARQWLYLAALRLVKQSGVRRWYEAKKARDGQQARRAVVAVMRKLALALYRVGAHGEAFSSRRLFGGRVPATASARTQS
jgi:transposase